MLDQIFSEGAFVNEIIWKRQSAHNDAKQGSKHLGRIHDSIFFYGGKDYCTRGDVNISWRTRSGPAHNQIAA